MKILVRFFFPALCVCLVLSAAPSAQTLREQWGADVLKYSVYGVKMAMPVDLVRKILHQKDYKPLLPEAELRRAGEEYVKLKYDINYSPDHLTNFLEEGFVSIPTGITPRVSYTAKFRNLIEENYPLVEPPNQLPYISDEIYYHEYYIITNGVSRSLPRLERREKGAITVLFNKERRVVAIEMVLKKVTEEEKTDVFDVLEDKYSKEVQAGSELVKFLVSRNIQLHVSYGSTEPAPPRTAPGTAVAVAQREYSITNFFFHTTKYVEALKDKMIKEQTFEELL